MASRREKAKQAKRAKVRKLKLELVEAMRDLLPEGSFAEREQAMLELTTEIENEIGKQELQELADSVGDKVEVTASPLLPSVSSNTGADCQGVGGARL